MKLVLNIGIIITALLLGGCMKNSETFVNKGTGGGGGSQIPGTFAFNGTVGVSVGNQVYQRMVLASGLDVPAIAANGTNAQKTKANTILSTMSRVAPTLPSVNSAESLSAAALQQAALLQAVITDLHIDMKAGVNEANNPLQNVNLSSPGTYDVAAAVVTFRAMYNRMLAREPSADVVAAASEFSASCLSSGTKNAALVRLCVTSLVVGIGISPEFQSNN